ncbi:MAG TPA: BRO family protein [Kangiella sp.]
MTLHYLLRAVFTHKLFGELRTLTDEQGNPWFVAKDMANALGHQNTANMTRCIDDVDTTFIHLTNVNRGIPKALGNWRSLTVYPKARWLTHGAVRN